MRNISVRRGVERLMIEFEIAAIAGLRAAPGLIWAFLPVLGWATASIFLGLIVGFAAVVLPPTGAFGIVAVAALVLLWVAPDLPRAAATRSIRFLFFAALIVTLCVPNYYTVQVSSLPWISARRAVLFPLIVLYAFSISVSPADRARTSNVLRSNKIMSIGVIGFLTTIAMSLFTSMTPTASLSAAVDAITTWFIPFFVALFVIKNDDEIQKIVKVVSYCSILICTIGIAEFVTQRHLMIELMPPALLERLMAANASVARMVNGSPFRDGSYRAMSIYDTALSFGEFAGMLASVGIYYIVYSTNLRDRALGFLVLVTCAGAVFCSGSRGGYLTFLTGSAVFTGLWYLRLRKFDPHSLISALIGVVASIGFAGVIGLILFWRRAHNMVLGGGMASYSTEARYEQWDLSIPHILSNPITGHGFDLGGIIIGNGTQAQGFTIDSYALSLMVETGIPSLILFFLLGLSAIWYAVERNLDDSSRNGALHGAFAGVISGFLAYRFFLSQHENFTLIFIIYGMMMVSRANYQARKTIPAGSGAAALSPVGAKGRRRAAISRLSG